MRAGCRTEQDSVPFLCVWSVDTALLLLQTSTIHTRSCGSSLSHRVELAVLIRFSSLVGLFGPFQWLKRGLERSREWDPPVGMFLLPRVELAAFRSATLLDIIPESFLLDYSLADLSGREEGKKVIRRSTIVLYIFSRMC